jgi:hypothetical protein
MPLILGAQSAVATGFSVDNSCRFNEPDTTYMHRTQTAGDQKTFTLSLWVKRSIVDTEQTFFSVSNGGSYMQLKFNGTQYLEYNDGPSTIRFITNREFRDPGAWYHICIKYDSTQSVEANRWTLFINGVKFEGLSAATSFSTSTYPGLNTDSQVNINTGTLRVGIDQTGAAGKFSGYLAEVVLIDGTAYDASSFGEFDDDSPTIWKPIDVSGLTFGTNGFYLDFKDSSDYGSDVSGEANDLTDVNLATTDQGTDSPTNNFATLSPLEYMGNSNPTFSKGNCQYVQGGSSKYFPSSGTVGLTSGKWYWEVQTTDGAKNGALHGIAGDAGIELNMIGSDNSVLGYSTDQWAISAIGSGYRNNNSYTAYGVGFYGNVIVGVYLDLDNNKLYFASGGTIMASGTGIDITAAASTDAGFYIASSSYWGGSDTFQYNFGGCSAFTVSSAQQDVNGYGNFEYSPNDGGSASFDSSAKDFLAVCTKNLGSDGG